MSNPVKGEALLKLSDGREFTLVGDFEALVQAEQAYGKPMAAMISDALLGFVGASRAILYGMLRTHHREVTLGQASEMCRTDGEAIEAAMDAASTAAFPDEAEGKEGANPPKLRRGKPSGDSGVK